ncbi:RNA-directed DNA polymerase, eukaryota, Reverse transcriptase zinc-binding domain protein [Artemisia annua]|uniref:RNA-directed DNA polymerase, eukaryota, Reverse transcriptase zinc-binding domain protein n=1 Tax=Artemisia annua TaxID=35608 RepID=A0A2U1NYY1_ARTAN|nr:RNA-directed DNA polymerase, eukaryota, Reverse transcriptase zinc-binding domain protein [Artemisia annua]
MNNVDHEGNSVPRVFVQHYEHYLGNEGDTTALNNPTLFTKRLDTGIRDHMVRPVSNEEIKLSMFSIGDNRAPVPDGYSFAFFKNSWEVVGNDVCIAVREFFY